MAHYKQDDDIKAMSTTQLRRALARARHFIRKHKKADGNARCWHNDLDLYDRTLPEGGGEDTGTMGRSEEEHLARCRQYVRRQQCYMSDCNGRTEVKMHTVKCPNCGCPGWTGDSCRQCGVGMQIGSNQRGDNGVREQTTDVKRLASTRRGQPLRRG